MARGGASVRSVILMPYPVRSQSKSPSRAAAHRSIGSADDGRVITRPSLWAPIAMQYGSVVFGNHNHGCRYPGGTIYIVPADTAAFHEPQNARGHFQVIQGLVDNPVERLPRSVGVTTPCQLQDGILQVGGDGFAHVVGNFLATGPRISAGGEQAGQRGENHDARVQNTRPSELSAALHGNELPSFHACDPRIKLPGPRLSKR